MYDVVIDNPVDVFVVYVIVVASCALLYPIARLIYRAIEGGVSKWR